MKLKNTVTSFSLSSEGEKLLCLKNVNLWVLGAGCWVLGVGCWVLGAGCWVPGADWVLGAGCQVPGARCGVG